MNTDRFRLKLYLLLFTTMLALGIAGFMMFENLSLVDSIYFSIVTMATVGYGDIHPTSPEGKCLALVLIVGGVGTFLGVVASFTDIFLNRRKEEFRRQKLNMVTGLFFSEIGTELLKQCAQLDPEVAMLHALLKVSPKWSAANFKKANNALNDHSFKIDLLKGDMIVVQKQLKSSASILLRMLENPVLQEHGNFTELLLTVIHLRDELLHRDGLTDLPEADRKHLEEDIIRVYKLLTLTWLSYMQYLKDNYAYMFSLAVRINPFDPEARAVVDG